MGLDIERIDSYTEEKAKGVAANRLTVVGGMGSSPPDFKIAAIKQRDSKTRPKPPFTTVSMQQAASVGLRFPASFTMRTAQQLYEGIDIPGAGSVGLITYMRTDSTHLAADAVTAARKLIGSEFGDAYLPDKPKLYSSASRAQQAHEASRPSDVTRTPQQLIGVLSEPQYKLYNLIWKRFVACQMNPAVWKVTEADVAADTPAGQVIFKAMGRQMDFDGCLRVSGLPKGGDQILPEINADQPVAPVEIDPTQHFTQPPPRFTEASLIKALEADGIGRPSTYASIIHTIQQREYVQKIERAFHPTDLGTVVTDKLIKAFPKIFDVRFTAHMEDQLDAVEEAKENWVAVLEQFYKPFSENLKRAAEEMVHAKAETEPSEYKCEKCGKEMVYRFSRNGRYLACTGYPECKQTHPVDKEGKKLIQAPVDVACPKCSEPM